MSKLKDQMLMEMELRNFSKKTVQAYLGHMIAYVKLYGKSPTEMGDEEIRKYLYYLLKEKQTSWSTINVAYCGLKFFYTQVLHRSWNADHIPRPKREKRLPNVLSNSEINRLFEATGNMKHRTILKTTYSGGLRVGEVSRLKVSDIDSARMTIRIDQSKGKKDRYTILARNLLPDLRIYYRAYRPMNWLFPGSKRAMPINVTTIQKAFKTSLQLTGIQKPVTTHSLRHSFATHFLENGGNLIKLKELLGHSDLRTTMIYIHLQHKDLLKAISPFDLMMEDIS